MYLVMDGWVDAFTVSAVLCLCTVIVLVAASGFLHLHLPYLTWRALRAAEMAGVVEGLIGSEIASRLACH